MSKTGGISGNALVLEAWRVGRRCSTRQPFQCKTALLRIASRSLCVDIPMPDLRSATDLPTFQTLHLLADQIHNLLRLTSHNLVLVESCTAGLVAAGLGSVCGSSQTLAGSSVVYQVPTKIEWLGITPSFIEQHTDVSAETSLRLAECGLARTPHASFIATITGHLGPNAPTGMDGKLFAVAGTRDRLQSFACQLPPPANASDDADFVPVFPRCDRQFLAAAWLFDCILHVLA